MDFQALKTQSRRALHDTLGFPALYYPPDLGPDDEPQLVRIRLHKRPEYLGDVQGTNLRYAEQAEVKTRIVVLHEEIPNPQRHALFMDGTGAGFLVDTVEPRDGITRTLVVVIARPDQIAGRTGP